MTQDIYVRVIQDRNTLLDAAEKILEAFDVYDGSLFPSEQKALVRLASAVQHVRRDA